MRIMLNASGIKVHKTINYSHTRSQTWSGSSFHDLPLDWAGPRSAIQDVLRGQHAAHCKKCDACDKITYYQTIIRCATRQWKTHYIYQIFSMSSQLVTMPCSIGYLRVKMPRLDWASSPTYESFWPMPTITPWWRGRLIFNSQKWKMRIKWWCLWNMNNPNNVI